MTKPYRGRGNLHFIAEPNSITCIPTGPQSGCMEKGDRGVRLRLEGVTLSMPLLNKNLPGGDKQRRTSSSLKCWLWKNGG